MDEGLVSGRNAPFPSVVYSLPISIQVIAARTITNYLFGFQAIADCFTTATGENPNAEVTLSKLKLELVQDL